MNIFNTAIESDLPEVLANYADSELPKNLKYMILKNHAKKCFLYYIDRFNEDVLLSDLVEHDWTEMYKELFTNERLILIEDNFQNINSNDVNDYDIEYLSYLQHAIKHKSNNFTKLFLKKLTRIQDILCVDAPFTENISKSRAVLAILRNDYTTTLDIALEYKNYEAIKLIATKLITLIKGDIESKAKAESLAYLQLSLQIKELEVPPTVMQA